jgi:hypothetical protein
MLSYGAFLAPHVAISGASRAFAAQINSLMPPGSPIYIFNPSIQPEIFYIHGQLLFEDSIKALPADVPWLLAPESSVAHLRERYLQSSIFAQPRDEGGRQYALLSLHGHAPNTAPKLHSKPKEP